MRNRSYTVASGKIASVGGTKAKAATLLAENLGRIGGSIVNDSTAILYIKLGENDATTDDYTYPIPGKVLDVPNTFELPDDWKGRVSGIWSAANGCARVTERRGV